MLVKKAEAIFEMQSSSTRDVYLSLNMRAVQVGLVKLKNGVLLKEDGQKNQLEFSLDF